MASSDYIPTVEANIIPWAENFIAVANINLTLLGLSTTEITTLTTKKTEYVTGLNNAIAKQSESIAATNNKNLKKANLVMQLRSTAQQIQARPGVPDSIKKQLGLKSSIPTPIPTGPFPPIELSYELISEKVILLKWNRNGNPQGVNFLIEASALKDKDYKIIDTTTKSSIETSYRDPSGKTYFQVRAKRGDITTEPSNAILI